MLLANRRALRGRFCEFGREPTLLTFAGIRYQGLSMQVSRTVVRAGVNNMRPRVKNNPVNVITPARLK